jgi:hypothetical protein
MNVLPLHPAIVHLPIALALLMPLFAAGVAWALWTGRVGPRAWMVVVVLQALLLGSALVAIKTGGAEEDRVERVVQESVLHQHEELAEQFAWATGATLGLAALVLALRPSVASRATSMAVVAATLVVAGLGLRVGHAGGELVYVHGAASAYTSPGQTGAGDDDDARRR